MKHFRFAVWLFVLLLASSAQATTITLSTVSSDETDAALLDATFDFSITGATELTLVVTNDTTAPDEFNVNQVFFNAADNVTNLTLDSAIHSDPFAGIGGDVTADWLPVVTNSMVDGFDMFDFGLVEGVGETNPSVVGPSEFVTFTFTISGTGPFSMSDFDVANPQGFTAAAKFVSGPGDDSAFGAVPEPATAALLTIGLIGLAAGRRGARR